MYNEATDRNARATDTLMRPGDIALLHDPQTAGLAGPLRDRGVRVVWRCHVGVDHPNAEAREAWGAQAGGPLAAHAKKLVALDVHRFAQKRNHIGTTSPAGAVP